MLIAMPFGEHAGEGFAGELRALVRIEDRGLAVTREGILLAARRDSFGVAPPFVYCTLVHAILLTQREDSANWTQTGQRNAVFATTH
jgi:hypothetical protein